MDAEDVAVDVVASDLGRAVLADARRSAPAGSLVFVVVVDGTASAVVEIVVTAGSRYEDG